MIRSTLLALADVKLTANLMKAAKPDDPGNGAGGFLDPAVDDERIELVGKRAGLTVFAVVGDFPLDRYFAVLVGLADVDVDIAVLRQPVDRIAGEGGFDPDRVGRAGFRWSVCR